MPLPTKRRFPFPISPSGNVKINIHQVTPPKPVAELSPEEVSEEINRIINEITSFTNIIIDKQDTPMTVSVHAQATLLRLVRLRAQVKRK